MENIFEITIDFQNRSMHNIKYKQGDTDGSVLKINLVGNGTPIDITGQDIQFNFLKPDNTIVIQNATNGVSITDALKGQFQCVLKNQTLAAVGEVQFEVSFNKDGKSLSTPTFKFVVEKSIGNGTTILSTNYISTIEDILLVINTAEGLRIANENNRSTAENTRAINEGIRVVNETSRLSVEGARVTAENSRVINETIRGANEITRGTNETSRVSAETSRANAETARNTAETTRNTNETTRTANETDRQNRFNALTTAQQQAAEVLNARTSTNKSKTFATLNDRLEALEADEITVLLDAQANTIRESIPSGFTTLSDIDYTYMATNPNTIKTLTESIAYVNGYKTVIPAATVITLNAPPLDIPRDDLVFLECYKTAAANGQVSWNQRYRVVDGVDFSIFPEGIHKKTSDASLGSYNANAVAQGGNTSPVLITDSLRFKCGLTPNIARPNIYANDAHLGDEGIYIAGQGDQSSKTLLATSDGYSYAIPMFKIHRRPSCGYMETNEYLKISPLSTVALASGKTSQARIAHTGLTGGVTTTIGGKTLVNLLGDAGNCEDLSKWTNSGSTLDTTIKLFGTNSFKCAASSNNPAVFKDISCDQAHKYLVSAYGYISSFTGGTTGMIIWDYGTYNNPTSINFDSTKLNQWQRKSGIITGKLSGGFKLFAGTTNGVSTMIVNIDGVCVYDLTDIYGAGNEPSDIAQLERELPFVNGVGHAQPSALKVTGKNLFNKDSKFALSPNTTVAQLINGFTVANTIAGTYRGSWYVLKLKPNTTYKLSSSPAIRNAGTSGGSIDIYNGAGTYLTSLGFGSSPLSVTTSNEGLIQLNFMATSGVSEVGSVTFTNVILEEGSTATTYEPYTESIANLPEECVDMKSIGTSVKDTLELSSGVQTKNISDWVTLDGNQGWFLDSNLVNLKSFRTGSNSVLNSVNNSGLVMKYNGALLTNGGNISDSQAVNNISNNVYINIANTDTGFCDSLIPTQTDIKAYFYGWKMCHSDGVSPYQLNQVNYNPSTWAEWSKPSGVVGDSTGLEITGDGVIATIPYINTTLKTSTKYGYLLNIVSNNISILNNFCMANSRTSTMLWNLGGLLGNQKFIDTTKSTITNNSIIFSVVPSEPIGNKVKIKDFRVFELPTGSQIETDFNTLTADQLTAKYLFYGLNPKNWKKVTDGTGITATLPTGSYSGYTPYKMIYQLATPVVTNIKEKIQGRNYYNVGYNGIEVKQVSSKQDTPIAVPNTVPNGDFSNGITGWAGQGATVSATNNILTVTGNGTDPVVSSISTAITSPLTQNRKFYLSGKVKVTNALCSTSILRLTDGVTSYNTIAINNPTQNQVYFISGIYTITSVSPTTFVVLSRSTYVDAATANGKTTELQQVFCLDLTAMFGAGNEPDQAWCDKYLAFGTNYKMVSPTNTTAIAISNDYGSRFEAVKGNVGVIPANKYSANKTYKLHYQKEDGSYVPPEVLVTIPVSVNVSNLMSKYNSVVQSDLDSYDLNNDGIIDVYDATIASQGSIGAQLTKNATVTSFKLGKPLIPYKKHSDGALDYVNILDNRGHSSNIGNSATVKFTTFTNIYKLQIGGILVMGTTRFRIVLIDIPNLLITFDRVYPSSFGVSNAFDYYIGTRTDGMLNNIIADRDLYNLRHQVSLTGFNYQSLLDESFDKLLRGEL